jgi:hypothetical protein
MPYPIPQIHLKTFKTELDHLVTIGVLASQQESEWASPSFIIPKKDGTKQSHKMQAISNANNHGYLTQAFWVQDFHKT